MTGLEWNDDDSLVGEMSEKDLFKLSQKIVIQESKLREKMGDDTIDILGITTYKQKMTYRKVGFWLSIHRSMCCFGTVFPGKAVEIKYDDDMAIAAGIIAAKYKRGWKHGFLDRRGSRDSVSGPSLRKVVEDLMESAKKDIDWYLDVEKPELDRAYESIFGGLRKIKTQRNIKPKYGR